MKAATSQLAIEIGIIDAHSALHRQKALRSPRASSSVPIVNISKAQPGQALTNLLENSPRLHERLKLLARPQILEAHGRVQAHHFFRSAPSPPWHGGGPSS
ncbi:unnamed protein product [Parascedosporium putredinis]|uniref:Uncharacterized protein n=1 Tax=Parascedosporium putredinis TaxID=1442378 RepID=A0A9P1GW74_9PEZI|nr:unnamed protein product [Parascedosporium putredinis]CAI7989257.1 unnamed protein product [Parascedosporium putredinis]